MLDWSIALWVRVPSTPVPHVQCHTCVQCHREQHVCSFHLGLLKTGTAWGGCTFLEWLLCVYWPVVFGIGDTYLPPAAWLQHRSY